jgi:hypothetical protein
LLSREDYEVLDVLLVENTLLVEDVKVFDTFESGEEHYNTEFFNM